MSNTSQPPDYYLMSSCLLPDPQRRYVYSSFLIDIPENQYIGLVSIISKPGIFKDEQGNKIKGFITEIVYKGFNVSKSPPRPGVRFDHPALYGFPHMVIITVSPPAGGATSKVTDIAD